MPDVRRALADSAITTVLLLAFAVPALAVDGVLEINQACAVNTGCFTGDTAGFPVTISTSGSYRLTGNLESNAPAIDMIDVTTDDVTLDLNGFELRCDLAGPCAGQGTGDGVHATGRSNVTVVNGTVTGLGQHGIEAGGDARIERVRAIGNGDMVTFGNGISVGTGSTVSGNTVRSNGDNGIVASAGSIVSGNTVRSNGNDGIVAFSASSVQRNTVQSNGGSGITLSPSAAYLENTINGNTGGTVSGGVNMGSNSCNGTATCP